ncbi:MAG: hypothetical protein V4642_12190 [Bacteroidota bacterium]
MFLKKQNKSFKNLFICTALFLSACTAPIIPPPCTSPANDRVVIRWGTQDENSGITKGYHLDAKADLFEIVDDETGNSMLNKLTTVDGNAYCRMSELVKARFLKAQTVNVPNHEAAFIEYANPYSGIYLRAVWIPKYAEHTGQQFQQLYDSLQTLVPQKD